MATTETVLRRSIEERGSLLTLTLHPAFQGLPDTAHGGSVLAAFDALASVSGPREVTGVYRKRVPLTTPLALAMSRADGACTFVLSDGASILVDGRVRSSAPSGRGGTPGDAQTQRAAAGARGGAAAAHPLPISRACFACGTDNELGLRARLEFDDVEVRGSWMPRAPLRSGDGMLTPAALTALADEAAFWLGALASGESGMTTDLNVRLHGAVPFGGTITVRGARASARPQADPRYWDTEVVLGGEDGATVASASITFVAVRGAARRLVKGMLAVNEPAVVSRVFPAYAR